MGPTDDCASPTSSTGIATARPARGPDAPMSSRALRDRIRPGIQMTALNPDLPTARAHQYNFTIEHEVIKDTVLRAGLIGTRGRNLEMMELFNRNPVSNYVWYVNTGLPLPTGTFANTARRSYDQTVYGDIRIYSKFGYSNFTGVQLEAERRFSKGMAFQFFYLLSNSMSTGATPSQGGDFTVNGIEQPDRFLPGSYPSSVADRERFYRYSRDGDIPKHHIRFNYLYDLPLGRGKKLLGNTGKKADRLVGGWQIAGYGSTNSRWFALPATNWGSFSPVTKYGLVPINDCRGGACRRALAGGARASAARPAAHRQWRRVGAALGLVFRGDPDGRSRHRPPWLRELSAVRADPRTRDARAPLERA